MIYLYAALLLVGLVFGLRYRFWKFLPVVVLAAFASIGLWLYRGIGIGDGIRVLVFVQISLQCGYFLGAILGSVIARYRRP
jgi:membrane protein DedA with SNARE-associated domain